MYKLCTKRSCSNLRYQTDYARDINNIENINQNYFIDFNNMSKTININKNYNKSNFQNFNDSSKIVLFKPFKPNTDNNNFNQSKESIIIEKQIPIKAIKSRDNSRNLKTLNDSYHKKNPINKRYVKIDKNIIPKISENPIKNIPISLNVSKRRNKPLSKNLSFSSKKNNNSYEEIDKKSLTIEIDKPKLIPNKKFISSIPPSPIYHKRKCSISYKKKINDRTESKIFNKNTQKNIKKNIELFNEFIPKPKKQFQTQTPCSNNNFPILDTNIYNKTYVSKRQQSSNLHSYMLTDEESESYIKSCIIIQKIFRGYIQRKKKCYSKIIAYKTGLLVIKKLFWCNLGKKLNAFEINIFKFVNNKQRRHHKKNVYPKKVIFKKIKGISFNIMSTKKLHENNDFIASEIKFLKNQINGFKEKNSNMQKKYKQLQNKINKMKKIYVKYLIYKKEFIIRYLLTKYFKIYCNQIKNNNQILISMQKLTESKIHIKNNMKYKKLIELILRKQLDIKQKLHTYFIKYYYNALFTKSNSNKIKVQNEVNQIEIIENRNVINYKDKINSSLNINIGVRYKSEKNQTENLEKTDNINNYFAYYDNMSNEEKEKLKRNKHLRDLFYNKIKERKNWLHNHFMKFYYKGLLNSIKNPLKTKTINNIIDQSQIITNKSSIENDTQKNIEINQNKNKGINDDIKKGENENKNLKNSGLNKARNLRKLLNQKGKEKVEILRKAFYKFHYNGMMCALRNETKNFLKKSKLGKSINNEISLIDIKENKNNNDLINFKINNNLEENKFDAEKYKKLESIIYKKELVIAKILKICFNKWRIISKIMSICLILDSSIKENKVKRKFRKAIKLSKEKVIKESKGNECSTFKGIDEIKK